MFGYEGLLVLFNSRIAGYDLLLLIEVPGLM